MEVCCTLLYGRMKRISSLFSCIRRLFFVLFFSFVSTIVFCNELPLLVSFFLLLLVWYGTPPSFSICFAKGTLFDLLTSSTGFSILFFLISTLFRCQVGFFGVELKFVIDVDLYRFPFCVVVAFEVVVIGYNAQV